MAVLNAELQQELDSSDEKTQFPITILVAGGLPEEPRGGKTRGKLIESMTMSAEARQAGLVGFLNAHAAARILNRSWLTNSITAVVNAAVLRALLLRKDIENIDPPRSAMLKELLDSERLAEARFRTTEGMGWGVERIGAPELWKLGITGRDVVVAVVDTGVNYQHPDLEGRMWTSRDPTLPYPGYDFLAPDADPMDGDGHGTKCAGIIAGDGTLGVRTGVAPGATIMALKIGEPTTRMHEHVFSKALEFAATHGADVVSMSITWRTRPNEPWWRRACEGLEKLQICHATSSGNEGKNGAFAKPENIGVPGRCPPPWLHPAMPLRAGTSSAVSCGAVDFHGNRSPLSGLGPVKWDTGEFHDYPYDSSGDPAGLVKPDVCAPGPETPTCNHRLGSGRKYVAFGGTSAAAAHLAGCMALLAQATRAYGLEPDPARIQEALERSAVKFHGQVHDKENDYGAGRINVFEAYQYGAGRGWWSH